MRYLAMEFHNTKHEKSPLVGGFFFRFNNFFKKICYNDKNI